MTVKGLHNLHNNLKAMEDTVMIQQNGGGNNNNGFSKGSHAQPKSPSSPNAPAKAPATIENSFTTRNKQDASKHIETIGNEVNPGLVQLREKANAAAAAYERHERDRELMRSSSIEEKRSSKEVGLDSFILF